VASRASTRAARVTYPLVLGGANREGAIQG
jgi:hypothetical protein